MKAKDYLKQIRVAEVSLIEDIEEVAKLETLATKTSSVMGGDRVQSSGSQQKMADCVVKIADLKNKITDEIEELLALKKEAKELLDCVQSSACRSLLHKRYFLFKSWDQIASEMNYTSKWVSGGLKNMALSQFQDVLDKMENEKNGTKKEKIKM